MRLALRLVALTVALLGVIDPPLRRTVAERPWIDVRSGADHVSPADRADLQNAVRDALRDVAGAQANAIPGAVVLVEPAATDLERIPDGVPIFAVRRAGSDVAPPRIAHVSAPDPVLPGQAAIVRAEIDARGLRGRMARVTLERAGVHLARAEQRIAEDAGRFSVALQYAPAAAGVHRVQIVTSVDGEPSRESDRADVAVVARARLLRVLVVEPRPSWAVTFVRRALEEDPVFAVSALSRSSRGVAVLAGEPPARLTEASLAGFDAIVVGAPDALIASELQALERFARDRGGAVVLMPDRRPSGAYVRLLPPGGFDEVLLESAVPLGVETGIRASELALARSDPAGSSALAMLPQGGRSRPAVLSWPVGAGRMVYSGALDAWRFRAGDSGAFSRFWSSAVANLALAAPRPLEASVEPALAGVGERVTIRASIRPTEFRTAAGRVEMPPVSAVAIDASGGSVPVRLWPLAEAGRFEGAFEAGQAGLFQARVSISTAAADVPFLVAADLRRPRMVDARIVDEIVRISGGAVVTDRDLGVLRDRIRALEHRQASTTVRPMRSAWWLLVFAGPLCAEWAIRRRAGLR